MLGLFFTDLDDLTLVILEHLWFKTGVAVTLDADQTQDLQMKRETRIKQKTNTQIMNRGINDSMNE